MITRPWQLSTIKTDTLTVGGYSVAGEESVLIVPELDVVFDIGKAPREALAFNHVLLTHGHMDHSAGLAYYFSQRQFQGMSGGVCLLPKPLVGPIRKLMSAWAEIEGHLSPHRLVGMEHGEDYEIRRNLLARAFATRHVGASLGYSIIEVRQKLKEEYLGLAGPEIVALKKKGVEIVNRLEVPLVTYMGDTARSNYSDLPHVRDSQVLLIECTFFTDEHVRRARAGKHIHVRDLPELLEGMNNDLIVLTHLTRRTNMAEARKILRKTLSKEVMEKVVFLMSRKFIEAD